jgi:hypothetical protein
VRSIVSSFVSIFTDTAAYLRIQPLTAQDRVAHGLWLRRGDFGKTTVKNFGDSFVILATPAEKEGLIRGFLDQRMPKQEAFTWIRSIP